MARRVTGSGPLYSYSWNTAALFNGAQLVNGPHVLTAIATDASGNTTVSSPVTVILNNPQGLQVALQLHADQTEVSGVANGSVVTPTAAPDGFTGAVVANGTGSVNFTPAETGNGVYFLNCCVNGNNAYYKFTGSTVGNIFNTSQGQIALLSEIALQLCATHGECIDATVCVRRKGRQWQPPVLFPDAGVRRIVVLQLRHCGSDAVYLFAAGNRGCHVRQWSDPEGADDVERRRDESVLE